MAEYGSARPSQPKAKKISSRHVVKKRGAQITHEKLAKTLHLDPRDPYGNTYLPHVKIDGSGGGGGLRSKGGKKLHQKSAARNFVNAGFKNNIRKGVELDKGDMPALFPLPACYSTGPVDNEKEKSYLDAKILNELRAKQLNGGSAQDAVPLYHRVSMDEGETYSDLLGRPFYFFDERKQGKAKARVS
jgi:hypothetical protein